MKKLYYTHRGSCFESCVGLSYLIQKMNSFSPLKTASPISIVAPSEGFETNVLSLLI
jgi:hypothetical protein